MARIAHITGRVILELTVQPSGEFTVSRAIGHPILVQAAKDSVQSAKLRCEGCGDEQHTFSIAYEFKLDDPPHPASSCCRGSTRSPPKRQVYQMPLSMEMWVDLVLLRRRRALASESHKHRLRLQTHSPDIEHFFLDLVFEGENVFCRCAAAIDDGQGMFARDSYRDHR